MPDPCTIQREEVWASGSTPNGPHFKRMEDDGDSQRASLKPSNGNHVQMRRMGENAESKESIFVAESEPEILLPQEAASADEETILINVGGQIFETFISTLNRLSCRCKLADEVFLRGHFRPAHGDFFFDRDPDAFKCVLNLLRTGQLHVPTHVCAPALKTELQYWGVDDTEIERCCWGYYNSWNNQSKALGQLEKDINSVAITHCINEATASLWQRVQSKVWNFLENPASSSAAKVYTWISILVVIISIFSFCAETHPIFQVTQKDDILADYFVADVRVLEAKQAQATSGTTASSSKDITGSGNNTTNQARQHMVAHPSLVVIDFMCLFFFTLEFLLRVSSSPAKLSFMLSPLNIIDFIAILPDYVELIIISFHPEERNEANFVDFIFILRIIRIFRILRLIRHVPGLWILLFTVRASFNELLLMAVFLVIGMVVFAALIYFAEGHTDTDFTNIPIGFWWSLVTMTTVGYGDMIPKTGLGYLVGSFCTLVGLLMLAFIVPIIVGNFVLYYTHIQYIISKRNKMQNKSEETLR